MILSISFMIKFRTFLISLIPHFNVHMLQQEGHLGSLCFLWDCDPHHSYVSLVLSIQILEKPCLARTYQTKIASAQPGMTTGEADIKASGPRQHGPALKNTASGIYLPDFNSWFCSFVALQAVHSLTKLQCLISNKGRTIGAIA